MEPVLISREPNHFNGSIELPELAHELKALGGQSVHSLAAGVFFEYHVLIQPLNVNETSPKCNEVVEIKSAQLNR
jgi:hypothetical protein